MDIHTEHSLRAQTPKAWTKTTAITADIDKAVYTFGTDRTPYLQKNVCETREKTCISVK